MGCKTSKQINVPQVQTIPNMDLEKLEPAQDELANENQNIATSHPEYIEAQAQGQTSQSAEIEFQNIPDNELDTGFVNFKAKNQQSNRSPMLLIDSESDLMAHSEQNGKEISDSYSETPAYVSRIGFQQFYDREFQEEDFSESSMFSVENQNTLFESNVMLPQIAVPIAKYQFESKGIFNLDSYQIFDQTPSPLPNADKGIQDDLSHLIDQLAKEMEDL